MDPKPKLQQLASWLEKPAGQTILKLEAQSLEVIWNYVLGDHLVLIGDEQQISLLEKAQHSNQLLITTDYQGEDRGVDIIFADEKELPLQPMSAETILLPHTLEFVDDPHHLLHQVDEIVTPGGYVIIIGFNPFSLYGLHSLFSLGRTAPWSGKFRRIGQVQDWLRLLDFDIVEQKQIFLHAIPAYTLLRRALAYLASVHIIVAQKRAFPVINTKERLAAIPVNLPNGMIEPASRGYS